MISTLEIPELYLPTNYISKMREVLSQYLLWYSFVLTEHPYLIGDNYLSVLELFLSLEYIFNKKLDIAAFLSFVSSVSLNMCIHRCLVWSRTSKFGHIPVIDNLSLSKQASQQFKVWKMWYFFKDTSMDKYFYICYIMLTDFYKISLVISNIKNSESRIGK